MRAAWIRASVGGANDGLIRVCRRPTRWGDYACFLMGAGIIPYRHTTECGVTPTGRGGWEDPDAVDANGADGGTTASESVVLVQVWSSSRG